MSKFLSRKFLLATGASVVAGTALFTGHMGSTEWLAAQGLILGLYEAGNVAAKRTT